jgi:hypothetical protein
MGEVMDEKKIIKTSWKWIRYIHTNAYARIANVAEPRAKARLLRMYIKIDAINGTRSPRARLVYERSIETVILLE